MKQYILRAFVLLIAVSAAISCGNDLQTVTVKGKYTIELPSNFKETSDLNKAASLQYQNVVKDIYAIVIDEPKEALGYALEQNSLYDMYPNDLKGYSKLITDGMEASISIKKMPDFEDTTINGLKARILSFEGLSSGHQVYWKLAFVEGNNTYYQIMVWTSAASRQKYEKEMTAIINSFEETDKSKKR
jgi:hypothetical protein